MRGVFGQHIGAHDQQADRAGGGCVGSGQIAGAFRDAARKPGMIDTDFRILCRCRGFEGAAQMTAGAAGIPVHQEADHVDDVFFRARQPVLQRQEVGAHVLGGAWDKAQNFWDAPEHRHLASPAGAALALALGAAPQPLQQRHGAATLAVHGELADPRQFGDLACRHAADHRVAMIAPGFQRGQHRLDVVFHEQHVGDDDVAVCDIV